MTAIYKGKLYRMADQMVAATLIDEETGEELTVSLGEPDLIVDPTDDEINNILPDHE
jgi:hypothetical protein